MFKLLVPCENVDLKFLFTCEIPTIDAKSCEEAIFTLCALFCFHMWKLQFTWNKSRLHVTLFCFHM